MILFPVNNCNFYEFSKSFETNIEGDKSPWEARQKRSVHMCLNDRDEKRNQLLIDSICLIFLQKKILTTNCKIVSHNDIRLLCLLRWFFHKRYLYFRLNREWQKETVTAGRTISLSFLGGNRWRILFFFDKTFITFCYRIYLFCQQYIFAETLDVCWWNISSPSSHILIWERNISRPCARLQAIS